MKKILKPLILLTIAITFYACNSLEYVQPKSYPIETQLNEFDSINWEKADWANGGQFNCGWKPAHVTFDGGIMTLTLNNEKSYGKPYTSGEFRSKKTYGYGTFEAKMKAAKGDGIVSSFFTYTNNPRWDEIDFEILGKDTKKVQVNYFVDGKGDHEKLIDLGFDAAEDFHIYKFVWTKGKIEWYVDGKKIHTATGSNLPIYPQQIMVNLWPGIGVDSWLKPFNYKDELKAQYDYIKYTPENTYEN